MIMKREDFMYCAQCGNKVENEQALCGSCNAQVDNATSDATPQRKPKPIAGIAYANDEFLVRSYHCTTLRFPKCDGHLSVTNRRVIFHGASEGSQIVHEVPLDAVSGVSTFYGGILFMKRLIVGLLIIGIAIFLAYWSGSGAPVFIGLVVGGIPLALCYRDSFRLQVYSSKASASPILIGEGEGGVVGSSAMFSIQARPAGDTNKMMSELGAMIIDLQTLGDFGIEKWQARDTWYY